MSIRKKNQYIVQLGLTLLKESPTHYTQLEVLKKIRAIDIEISESTLSNIKTGKKSVGSETLQKVADNIKTIIEAELGKVFDPKTRAFEPIGETSWKSSVIPIKEAEIENKNPDFINLGRFPRNEKVALYQLAQKQIIELGIRLRTFTNYFIDESDANFKKPILDKLDDGVHFHCYVLKDNGRFAQPYFKDRDIVQKGEINAFLEMPLIKKEIVQIFKELNKQSSKGKMHLHTYDCFPYFHGTVIDGASVFGKICITQYLYGISRANSPRFQVDKKHNLEVYTAYWDSINAIISNSNEIDLETFSE